ncbi:hypothetical protein RCL_jg26328.t2 [Rhizophagus clarus]|uniref:Uncharacterized protein n=1 Tax=Rhizophagus clarus TaxID=94130 RepID=A0A8H3KV19_9GLOM|nr:hypothetical protein RCL_jg26328.t2 [Rhizophagus clarus]
MSKEEFQYLASVTTSSDLFFMIIQRVISLFFHKEFLKRTLHLRVSSGSSQNFRKLHHRHHSPFYQPPQQHYLTRYKKSPPRFFSRLLTNDQTIIHNSIQMLE